MVTVHGKESIQIIGRSSEGDPSALFSETVGPGQGSDLFVYTPSLLVEGGWINASTEGKGKGGDVTVTATDVAIRLDNTGSRGRIATPTTGQGRAGDIFVATDTLEITGGEEGAFISSSSSSTAEGDAGDVAVQVGRLILTGGAGISSETYGSGDGGTLTVQAKESMFLNDGSLFAVAEEGSRGDGGRIFVSTPTLEMHGGAIEASTSGEGAGGEVEVEVDRLTLARDGGGEAGIGRISAATFGRGDAGRVFVSADTVEVTGGVISSSSEPEGQGDAGDVEVQARRLTLTDGAGINSETYGSGDGGTLTVQAKESMFLNDSNFFAAAEEGSRGDGGRIFVSTPTLEMHGGAIEASTAGEGGGGEVEVKVERLILTRDGGGEAGIGRISAATFGSGDAGRVFVSADTVELIGGVISSISESEDTSAGQSGEIDIRVIDTLTLRDGGRITVETAQADAHDITLDVGFLLHLQDNSQITTSVADGKGSGGNITIDPVFVVLDGESKIVANAQQGKGGNIRIHIVGGGALFKSADSTIDASSEFGVDGAVEIDAPDTDITGSLVALSAVFFDPTTVMTKPCVERSGANVIHFVVREYEVLPDSPYGLRTQLPKGALEGEVTRPAASAHARPEATPGWRLEPVYGCGGDA